MNFSNDVKDKSSDHLNDDFSILHEKMLPDIIAGKPYDSLQYVQSFVARKKKSFGPSKTSSLIFYGSEILLKNGHAPYAGVLVAWFINNGPGGDFSFKIDFDDSNTENYCDLERTNILLEKFSSDEIAGAVDKIYDPLIKKLSSIKSVMEDSLKEKLVKFENLSANAFEKSRYWPLAMKSIVRLGDMERASHILHFWANEGYPKEYPIFFARATLQLLSEGKIPRAIDLVKKSFENYPGLVEVRYNGNESKVNTVYDAVWHLAIILTELAELPPSTSSKDYIDKTLIFEVLEERYSSIVNNADQKLSPLLTRIGQVVFEVQPKQNQSKFNPMAMLGNLLGGGGGMGGTGGGSPMSRLAGDNNGMDIMKMMNMFS